jgi:hypothetical protein
MKKIFIFIIGCAIVLTPVLSVNVASAAMKPIVPSCNTGDLVDGKNKGEKVYKNPCDFNYLMVLINNIIDFLFKYIVTSLTALALVYAGFLLIFSGGSSEKVTKAKAIIKNVVIGFIIALAAWLIVKTILTSLGYNGDMYLTDY